MSGQGTFFSCEPYGTCWEPVAFAEPELEAHRIGDRGSGVQATGIRIAFDHKSQSFMLARQGVDGNRSTAGLGAFNGRMGSIQGHGGGASRGSGHSSGGGFSGGGGGFHGGGASAGGGSAGGASHGGGGGGGKP
jgi:hypothetical protein